MRRGSRQTQRPASEPPGPTVAADDAPTSCLGDNGTASLPWALSTATCSAQVRRPASRPSFPTPSQPQRPTPRCRQICAGTTSSCSNFPGGSVHFRLFPLEKISPAPGNRIPYDVDLAYDYDETAAALTDDGPDSQHLVEVDTVILDKLINAGAVQPFEIGGGVSFLPAALEAVTWGGSVYGVPHWTCGYFVISRLEEVREAGTLTELLSALETEGTNAVDLVGDLDGSWDSIVVLSRRFQGHLPGREHDGRVGCGGTRFFRKGWTREGRSGM